MKAGILIFPAAEELDFVGPWEMLTMWQKVAGGPECLMVAQSLEPVVCAKGLSVNPHFNFAGCPELDILLVPGGMGTRREVANRELIEFISVQAKCCQSVLSVCTGSFLLYAAGLLNGRKATTHWASLDRLRSLEGVTVEEQRFVRDGKFWTSAGVSAGIDMTLAFIGETAGHEAAGKVQLQAEYYPSDVRYGDFSEAPGYVNPGRQLR